MLQALFGFLCVFSLCFAVEESDFVRRISMLLWIKQTGKALSECKCARKLYPDSEVLKKMYVEALAKEQYAKKAYRHLKKYAFDKDIKENFSLVEEVAWSFLLQQNDTREHLMIPSLMGASLAKDALGVQFLLQGIASQNFSVRLFSLRLAERYRDEKVSQAVLEAFKREKNWILRLEMIKVLGHHKYKEALDPLYQQLQKLDLSYEEETALSHALLSIEKHPREDLKKKCLKSARSSLRNYAIDVYLHRMKEEAWPLILPLIKDPSLFVRKKILLSAVFHHAPKPELVKYKSTLEEYLHSHFADLSLLSAFTLLKLDHPEAPKILRKRVLSPIVDEAIFAAALWALGKEKMHQSSFELFDEIQNPYVKMTLGMGLMRRGECNDKIKDFFVQFLKNHRELIMIESHEDFPILMVKPSTIKHNLGVANYPKYLDMNFRLYLLNLLATYDPKAASRFVAEFAFADMTGVSVHAMAILLQEAKYSRLDWLENLLENEQEEIRLRAALCLCMFGRFDETIFTILQEAYHKKTWEKKIELLETIAFNADQKYVPFLFDRLEESSGILRSIAASGIIQCLYH